MGRYGEIWGDMGRYGACPAEDEHVHVFELVERVELRGAVSEPRRPAKRRGEERVEPAAVAADGEPSLQERSRKGRGKSEKRPTGAERASASGLAREARVLARSSTGQPW